MKRFLVLAAILLLVGAAPSVASPINVGPSFGAILDLAGTPLQTGNNDWTHYSVNFTATLASTDVTFQFRNDPGFTAFDDVSVTLGAGPNLITNGSFESGLTGWTYDNVFGAAFGGGVSSSCAGVTPYGHSGANAWCDGAVQAYDAIDQIVSTVPGQTYTISFWQTQILNVAGIPENLYQQFSTDGDVSDAAGNGIDTLVFVGASIPNPVPEPGTIALFATGLAALGVSRFRKIVK